MPLTTECGYVRVGDLWEDTGGELNIVTDIDVSGEIQIQVVYGKTAGQHYVEIVDNFDNPLSEQEPYFTTLVSRSLNDDMLNGR